MTLINEPTPTIFLKNIQRTTSARFGPSGMCGEADTTRKSIKESFLIDAVGGSSDVCRFFFGAASSSNLIPQLER